MMSKLKIEHGASRINLVLLKTNIEDTIAQDIDLMASWSGNDRKYIVNELLRFALAQEEDFLKYKAGLAASPEKGHGGITPLSSPARTAQDASAKSGPTAAAHA